MDWIIPPNPPSDKLQAAHLYRNQFGWTVHPLASPIDKNLPAKSRGKKPMIEAWPGLTLDTVTEEFIEHHWGNGLYQNLGVVVRPPHVVVDLDSKSDSGESVRLWLDKQNQMRDVPREKTGGGCHLHFICQDLPDFSHNGKSYGKALSAKLGDKVTAELFFNGQNIVVAPSQHANGTAYAWQVTGRIPEITWKQLQDWFGFVSPSEGKLDSQSGKAKKVAAWWTRFEGDFVSMDIVKLTQSLEIYGEPLGGDEGKHSVKCPWQAGPGCTLPTAPAIFRTPPLSRPSPAMSGPTGSWDQIRIFRCRMKLSFPCQATWAS